MLPLRNNPNLIHLPVNLVVLLISVLLACAGVGEAVAFTARVVVEAVSLADVGGDADAAGEAGAAVVGEGAVGLAPCGVTTGAVSLFCLTWSNVTICGLHTLKLSVTYSASRAGEEILELERLSSFSCGVRVKTKYSISAFLL
jgi:hypothetical protein